MASGVDMVDSASKGLSIIFAGAVLSGFLFAAIPMFASWTGGETFKKYAGDSPKPGK